MGLLWVPWVSMLTACVAIPMDAAAGSHSLFTCEPITLRMCQELPYNATFMPNALNHYDQQTAALAMEVRFARYFIGVVSIVCLSATVFTFLTFLIDVSRFRYPERPIIFYAVCYMMVSLVFFLGFLLEDRVACNAAVPGRFRASTVTQGSHNKACTLLFMVLYFFTLAGSVWWVILTVTWFLAAVPKWGSEAIEKKALLFHACAWGVPGALTVSLLAMNKIEGDGVSGVCFVGLYDLPALRWFLLAPLGVDVVVSKRRANVAAPAAD